MSRARPLLLLAVLATACVSVQPAPDPRGSVRSGQTLVVIVYQAPGPWIHADADSKAEAAAKILPIGFMMQGLQDDRINELSKELQPYLPRPRYDAALERELVASLKTLHDGPVLTAAEAGINYSFLREANAAPDTLEWRRKYFSPDPTARAPRDYARLIALDGFVIVDVSLNFGTVPVDTDGTNPEAVTLLPALSAATRLYDGGTVRQLWSREDQLTDKSATFIAVAEYRAQPAELTRRLESLAPPLGRTIAESLARGLGLRPAPPPPPVAPPPAPPEPVAAPIAPAEPTAVGVIPVDSSTAPAPSPAPEPSTTTAPAPPAPSAP